MAWFGKSWFAPVCREEEHVATPAGQVCLSCDETIEEGDQGVFMPHVGTEGITTEALHLECQMRMIIGGLNHLRGQCSCCGGTLPPDPPELSKREAAKAAVEYWERGRLSAY